MKTIMVEGIFFVYWRRAGAGVGKIHIPLTPQFSEIGPFKLTENCENENYELCSNWAGKNRKLRGLLGCLDRKLRGMSMIWNTENCENENYGGENCGVTVYVDMTAL